MKWEKFNESEKELPEVLVEKSIDGFSSATKQLAQLYVVPYSDLDGISSKLKNRFRFNTRLTSPNIPEYSFKVFQMGYDVTLYPVSMIISPAILSELQQNQNLSPNTLTIVDSQEELEILIELIFNSEKFKEIVSGLMKIARLRQDTF